MKFKSIFSICLLTVCAIAALTFAHCVKEKDPSGTSSTNQNVVNRDDQDPGIPNSNYVITYKIDGQNATEQAFNALSESDYKHAIVTEALPNEPTDLLHVEMWGFTTRAGYEAWGVSKGLKVKEGLEIDDRLQIVADSAGLTEASPIPQWFEDYATELSNLKIGIPNLCYLGVNLRQHTNQGGAVHFAPPTKPFVSLLGHFMDNRASSQRFLFADFGCEPPLCNLKAYDNKFWTKLIMTITVKAGVSFNYTNSFSPLNDRISSFQHWSNF